MIPAEVESLQSQLVDLQLAVDEFFAILLSMYDLDLCKESFSDGNDMVTHWKSHVKKQQVEASRSGGRGRGGARGRAAAGRGRPRRSPARHCLGSPGFTPARRYSAGN